MHVPVPRAVPPAAVSALANDPRRIRSTWGRGDAGGCRKGILQRVVRQQVGKAVDDLAVVTRAIWVSCYGS
jgi:hypothetical protein